MRYASISQDNGVFRIEKFFNSAREAKTYSRDGLVVAEPTARMLEGREVSHPDTPNFQHFREGGQIEWYRDPESHARMVFSAVTGIEIGDKEFGAAKHPIGVYVRGVQVFAGHDRGEIVIVAFDGDETAVRVRVSPYLYRVDWWKGDESHSAPPLPLPEPAFFRRHLRMC